MTNVLRWTGGAVLAVVLLAHGAAGASHLPRHAVATSVESFGDTTVVVNQNAVEVEDGLQRSNYVAADCAVATNPAFETVSVDCWLRDVATGERIPVLVVGVGTSAGGATGGFKRIDADSTYEFCAQASRGSAVGPERCTPFA